MIKMSYAKRVAYASFDAIIAAIVFIVIPLYILPMIERYFGVNVPLYSLPYLGFMMVAASFFSGFSKKTRYEGAAVIVWSIVTIIYLSYILGRKVRGFCNNFRWRNNIHIGSIPYNLLPYASYTSNRYSEGSCNAVQL